MKSAPSKMRVLALLIAGAVLVYFAVKFFTGKAPVVEQTSVSVRRPPRIESVPGSVKDNERYKELQEKDNTRRAEQGLSKGISALPTLVNRLKDEKTDEEFFAEVSKGPEEAPVEKNTREEALKRAQEEADKRLKAQQERLDRLRQEQENRRQAAANARQSEKDNKDRQKYLQDLSNNILADMNSLVAPLRSVARQSYVAGTASATPVAAAQQSIASNQIPLYKAGSIIYGVIVSNYDSDDAAVVRARIVSGPLAGSTLIGTVGTPQNTYTKNVPITFNTLAHPQAMRSQAVSLRAINPQTQGPGAASTVNYHYGQRYGAMVLSGLLKQVSQQLQNSSSSGSQSNSVQGGTASSEGSTSGANNTAENSSTTADLNVATPILNDIASSLSTSAARPATYKIAQGTPIGLLFENDFVLEF